MSHSLELVITKGTAAGKVVPLVGGSGVTLGSAPDNTVVLAGERVDPHQARIDLSLGGAVLKELDSRFGTYVGKDRLWGTKRIAAGVAIRMGDTVFEVRERRAPIAEVVLSPGKSATQGNLARAQRNLTVLTAVGDLLSTEHEPERFLTQTLKLIFEVLHADRGAILLVDKKGEFQPRVTRDSQDTDRVAEIDVSRTILSKVLEGMSVLTADAGADPRLAAGASIFSQHIRSAMCVPIRSRGKCLGAIYIDTVVSVGVFTGDDLEMLSIVGALTGTALDNIQLVGENLQRERLAAVGMVVAGLGHDVRNMLMIANFGMEVLGGCLRDADPTLRESAWKRVSESQEAISGLVLEMLIYSKAREPAWERADFNGMIASAIEFVRPVAAKKAVRIEFALDPAIGSFWFDAKSLARCAMNLLTNAIDAAKPQGGVVHVMTCVGPRGGDARLVVLDDGPGIAPENCDKVFDLLFSTKGERGTGFGLAITKKIVEEHGGHVSVRSQPGHGAAFTIEIPMREKRPASVGASGPGTRRTV